ncbi:Aldo/keto reductase [Coniochaeta ligniaria NRRL 30616]|uniref:Aldo/keto reductase n=1 Tax=Coniochaeta ligniaria NRRL 30616 TaxID=1408157 RepID=A0A1J7IM03_9PEZI|nr:Aldo/keto reductase [Coniochaeta ligniaria NRRL 30616]
MKAMRPSLGLGPGALTQQESSEHINSMLTTARELGINSIDASTAHAHPEQHATGSSEQLLGQAQAAERGFAINAAVESNADGRCSLNRGQVWESVKGTLARLGVEQVDVLYIHAPDSETLLEQQAAAMDDLFRQGKFKRLGVANFSLIMLQDYLTICQQNNYVRPSVFAVTYNLIWRFPEAKLIPLLRQHGITVAAQSPLAGGLLAGRFAPEQLRGTEGERYRRTYAGKPGFHAAAADLVALVSPHGMSPAEASLRWLCWHSDWWVGLRGYGGLCRTRLDGGEILDVLGWK